MSSNLLTPRRAAAALIALYVVLGVVFSIVFPIFESWDELQHYDYVRYLIEERRLPIQPRGGPKSEYHQPPGYYLIAAAQTFYLPADPYRPAENPAFAQPYWYRHNKNRYIHPRSVEGWPWRGTKLNVQVTRLFGVLWGALTLALTYHLALRLRPEGEGSAWFAVGAVGLAAFNGTFVQLMSGVNNEVMAAGVGAGLSLVLADVALHGLDRRRAIITGVLVGLAALTKWTMLAYVGALLGAVAISEATWRRPKAALGWLGVVIGIGLLIGGWWYVRNVFVYGEPLAASALYDAWDEGRPADAPSLPATIYPLLTRYWGSYGASDSLRTSEPLLSALVAFTVGGLVGVGWRWLSGRLSDQDKRVIFVLGGIAVGFFLSALVAGSQSRFGIQQRWLLAAHAAASVVLALGWWHVMEKVGARGPVRLAWVVLPLIALLASLFGQIIPAYAPPRAVEDPAELVYDSALDVSVGDFATLIGASTPATAQPGSLAWVRVCWQTTDQAKQDYWLFVHVVGRDTERLAGIDSVPGRGNYPTSDWQVGTAHCTDWPVEIPGDAPPGQYSVHTGLYERETLARLETTWGDGTPFEPPVIGTVIVPAAPGSLPPEATVTDVDFGGVIRLRGVDLPQTALRPGDELAFRLYWEALAPVGQPYTVFVHLTPEGSPGEIAAQADSPPRGGLYPSDLWPVGGLVPDERVLALPSDLAGGTYRVRVGLYDPISGARLPGPEPDGGYTLPPTISITQRP